MKKYISVILVLLCFLLSACGSSDTPATETTQPVATTLPTETLPPETTQPPTEPEQPRFCLPGTPVEDVILSFSEVCLDAEMINAGDPNVLQKWVEPIRYVIYGEPTEEDSRVLSEFADWLNGVDGFPGIRPVQEGERGNLRIYFCDADRMLSLMGENFSGLDGAVTFWYEENQINDAIICYRTDIDQYTRNSVILEELYNGLGPIQDTNLRPDSIIYSGFSEPQRLTEMDELILKLLYHPQMHCGMDAEGCAAVIRQLYYEK